MKSSFPCPQCGLNIGSHQVHSDEVCQRQQEVNRLNLGLKCNWCGSGGSHKDGCPSKRPQREVISIENVEDLEDFENEYGKFHSYSDEEMDQFMK